MLNQIDKKTFAIGCLSLSAVILVAANMLMPHAANANFLTIQDNDYSMVVATSVQGDDALYVTEKRSGLMAVFVFDANTHKLVPKDVQPIQAAFSKALAGGAGGRNKR